MQQTKYVANTEANPEAKQATSFAQFNSLNSLKLSIVHIYFGCFFLVFRYYSIILF